MYQRVKYDFKQELIKIKDAGLFKEERLILSSQKPTIHVSFPAGSEPREVLNFCSNNYLGLANHPDLIRAAHEAMDRYGFGLAKEPVPARNILIATDGVFSINGDIADIKSIVELAGTYDALVMVDDSHATDFLGKTGRGSIEYNNVFAKVGRKHGVI